MLAAILSVAALALTFVCLSGGLAVAFLGRHSPLLIGLGVILAVTSVAVWPRPLRLDKSHVVLDPAEAPRFWELLLEIAGVLETKPPKHVAFDLEPNASVRNVGLRSHTVLTLGAPLWVILDGQERIGLLAHELGHLANHDPRQGRLVALGSQTLARWRLTLLPPPSSQPSTPRRWLEDLITAGLRLVLRGWIAAIARLQTAAVQRSELRSDRAAARVAGWKGYTGLLDQLHYAPRLENAVHVAAARRDGTSFYDSISDSLRSTPERENERLRRLAAQEPYDRGLTHPPTRLRLRAVEHMQSERGLVVPASSTWTTIDAELAPPLSALAEAARATHNATKDRYAGIRPPRSHHPNPKPPVPT